jgi:type IV pilus assembly protein PilA
MKNLQKGFSLIELLVVVAIIGILAAIGSVGYSKYIANAKGAANTANVSVIADALKGEDAAIGSCANGDDAITCAGKIADANQIKNSADKTLSAIVTDCPDPANGTIKVVNGPKEATISSCEDVTISKIVALGNNIQK